MTDDEIVDAEIVEGAGEADDVIESLDDMADDATIDDADVVETSTAGEAGIADPEVIALLRDTTGEMARRPRAGEPESGAGSPSTSPASQPVPAAGTGPSAPAPPRGPTSPIETSAHAAAPAEPTGLPDSPESAVAAAGVSPDGPATASPDGPSVPSQDPDDLATLSFPRLSARTQRFTLGEPRNVTVAPDGTRILFLRSKGPADPVNCLWVVDATTGAERLIADPAELLAADDDRDLPAEELARRERARESAGGITGYAIDADATLAAFALAGRLFVADVETGEAGELPVEGPVFDPRPDPRAQRVAYVSGSRLCVAGLDGTWHTLAGDPDDPASVSWGTAEFIAAEEMGRFRGYWWSPDGSAVAVTRVDTAPVQQWYVTDPAAPALEPRRHAYPPAGTANADVSLHLVDLATRRRVDVHWDRARFPYLTAVEWSEWGLLLSVQTRDQREVEVRDADPVTGRTSLRFHDTDAAWVELVPGSPRWWGGRLVVCADRHGARRLLVDGTPVTPPSLQVRSIASADDGGIVLLANPLDDATVLHVWRYTCVDGETSGTLEALTDEPGIHGVAAAGPTVVIRTATVAERRTYWETLESVELRSHAAEPPGSLNISFGTLGTRRIATAVVLPSHHGGAPLPVLLDPYGGPHALRAVRARHAHLTSQWFADQGFAVVVADGRGTPGRGSGWERAVQHDLATAVLEDQVDALEQAAAEYGCFDLDRVAVRGWSFGGYLAALAVLLRPDRFHAAVAGAPVTDWRLYDTHYTERYLGDPVEQPDIYEASSLLPLARHLRRPLLLIHGLADDNVVAAHTLRLSSALLAEGKHHEVLPLVGVTHMTPQEVVAENLLLHQLAFLRRALDVGPSGGGAGLHP